MKAIILGGGLSGLAAGYRLSKAGNEVTILEKEDYLGGLASSYTINWDGNNYWLTKTYHHILHGDETTFNIIKELGLESKLNKRKVKTGFIYNSKIFGFSTPLEILRFPLPLMDKIRLAKFILKVSRKKRWDDVERMNAREWIVREAGEKNFKVFFDQLIINKFHQPAEEISAAWFGTRFAKEPSSFLKKFGWLEGGVQQIIDGLAKGIEKNGGSIKTDTNIERIVGREKSVVYVRDGKKTEERVDAIVSTLPPEIFLGLANMPAEEIEKEFKKIGYLSCICACIGLSYNPTEYYWLNVLDKTLPFVVVFNQTALYEDSAPPGKAALYLLTYLRKTEDLWKKDEKEIFEIYMNALEKIFPGCRNKVEWHKITKFEHAEAIFGPDFQNPPISDDGLYFAGIYRIFPKIRNMASAIESGFEAADAVLKER